MVAIAVTAAVTVPSMIIILIILIIIGVWYMRRRGNHDGPVHFHGGMLLITMKNTTTDALCIMYMCMHV